MSVYPTSDVKTRGAEEVILEAKTELACAINQMSGFDDQIICDHVRKAAALLSLVKTKSR